MAQFRTQWFLLDDRFSHDVGTVAGITPSNVEWAAGVGSRASPVFFSHERMLEVDWSVPKRFRFGLLIESVSQAPELYRRVHSVMESYQLVFTHDSRLLKKYPNTRWIPGGGIWIGGSHGGTNPPDVFAKNRSVFISSSNKLRCRGHKVRYSLAKKLEQSKHGVDVFRQRPGGLKMDIDLTRQGQHEVFPYTKLATHFLKDYRYSIMVENYIDDLYFTERLLNCFATGTVPVYRGARNIGSIFDPAGIISWTAPRQLLNKILPRLSEEDYESRLPAIKKNFNMATRFRTIEDYIFEEYGTEIHSPKGL